MSNIKTCDPALPDIIEDEHFKEIYTLKNDIISKQERIAELENLNNILFDERIESFYDGKFSNEVMTLLTECSVS